MAMSIAAKTTTADELYRMPDDGYRYELVEGDLRKMTPAGSEHGAISMELGMRLAQHVRSHQLGMVFCAETGFQIGPDTVLAPDAAFVRQERLNEVGIPKTFFPESPALVVEVVSPCDTVEHVDEKMRHWLASGVELAWVVHPTGRTVTVYRSIEDIRVLTEKETLTGNGVLRGFQCLVGELFARLSNDP